MSKPKSIKKKETPPIKGTSMLTAHLKRKRGKIQLCYCENHQKSNV